MHSRYKPNEILIREMGLMDIPVLLLSRSVSTCHLNSHFLIVEPSCAIMNSLIIAGKGNLVFQCYHSHPARFWNMNEWFIYSARTPPPLQDLRTIIEYVYGRERKQAKWALGSRRWQRERELKSSLCADIWPLAWELMWALQRWKFSRMLCKEQDIHCFPGEDPLEI